MTVKIIISTVVAFFIAASPLLGPMDPLFQLVLAIAAAVLCFVPLFVLSRMPFVRSATGPVQTLISVLICMLALSAITFLVMRGRIAFLRNKLDAYRNAPTVESSGDVPEERSQVGGTNMG